MVNGEPAYICYISPVQINVLTSADLPTAGRVTVQVSSGALTSSLLQVSMQPWRLRSSCLTPAGHVAATHADNTQSDGHFNAGRHAG